MNIIKNGDSITSVGKLCQCLLTLTVNKCCLIFRQNLLCFCLCPLPLVLSLGTNVKSLARSCLHPSFRYLYTLIRYHPRFLFSRLNNPCSLSLSSQERCSSPSVIFMALHWTISSRAVSLHSVNLSIPGLLAKICACTSWLEFHLPPPLLVLATHKIVGKQVHVCPVTFHSQLLCYVLCTRLHGHLLAKL